MSPAQRLASLVCALLLLPNISAAQQQTGRGSNQLAEQPSGAIEGTIRSEEGAGIAGAIITLEPSRLVEYTDPNGAFAFRNIPPGVYMVLVNFGALESRDTQVSVASNEVTSVSKV